MTIARRIQAARQDAGLTQLQLAGKLGVSLSTITSWEQGRQSPRLELFAELAKELNVSADELLYG